MGKFWGQIRIQRAKLRRKPLSNLKHQNHAGLYYWIIENEFHSPLSLMSQTITMAPRLASLRDRSLPNPPPPPVTRAISPLMLFILYLFGMKVLTMPSNIAKIDSARKTITSPIEYRYVMFVGGVCGVYMDTVGEVDVRNPASSFPSRVELCVRLLRGSSDRSLSLSFLELRKLATSRGVVARPY